MNAISQNNLLSIGKASEVEGATEGKVIDIQSDNESEENEAVQGDVDGTDEISASHQDEPAEEDSNEDDDDFKVAWEILDSARIILSDHFDEKSQLKLAHVYMLLGDVSMESEAFDQAAADFNSSVQIKKLFLKEDSRIIAEAYYKYAIALEYAGKRELALEAVQNSLQVLTKRLAFVETTLNSSKGKEKAETGDDYEGELRDLKELFPDMEAKIEDLKAAKASFTDNEALVANDAAQDVNSLIKRRKIEEKEKPVQSEEQQ